MTDVHDGRRGGAAVWVAVASILLLVAGVGLLVDRTGGEPVAGPTPVPSPASTAEQSPEDLVAQIEEIAATVESMREMTFDEVPTPQFVTQEEVAEQIVEDLDEYTEEEAELDRRLLAALGAVAEDADLREMLLETLAEQVAGRYEQDTGELVVVAEAGEEPLGPTDRVTLVHELGHALVDQRIGLPDLGVEIEEGREDSSTAAQAVVEGDATLLMLQYAQQHLTVDEQRRMAEEQRELAGQMQALDALPHYVRRTLMFPYEEGTVFAAQVHQQRGWQGLDEALRDPPETTLEILAPEHYLSGDRGAATVREAVDPGADWEREARRGFGAADLLFLFEAPGDEPEAALSGSLDRATGWRGGEMVLWGDGERDLAAVLLVGDGELCTSVADWYRAAFPAHEEDEDREGSITWVGDDREAHLACDGTDVRLGIGPDRDSARAVTR